MYAIKTFDAQCDPPTGIETLYFNGVLTSMSVGHIIGETGFSGNGNDRNFRRVDSTCE